VPALSRRTALRLLAVTVGLFAVCTAVTAAGMLDGLDRDVAAVADGARDGAGDVVLPWVAFTASVAMSAGWLALLAALSVRYPCWRPRAAVLGAAVLVGLLLEVLLKHVVDHPGPLTGRDVVTIEGVLTEPGSYPSGHVLRGMALAGGCALLVTGRRRAATALALAAVYTVVVAWTRLYLNAHWASDVLGGLLVGLASLIAVAAVPERTGAAAAAAADGRG
jgi:membrane-associated phospholipid phosphatase